MKAIYKPKGKAREYAEWACNFYVGCSNECSYCYLKKGVLKNTMGGCKPVLKKCFINEDNAIAVFEKELKANITELRKHGLFYSFTTDPMIPQTQFLTFHTAMIANEMGVPVKILTKHVGLWVDQVTMLLPDKWKSNLSFGFTLTGHDELEHKASTNAERVEAMKKLHKAGFKTFASMEPVVDTDSTAKMMLAVKGYCDLFMVGLMSGAKYDALDLRSLMLFSHRIPSKFYWKDSFIEQARMNRNDLPGNCVDRNHNLFTGL